MTKTSHSLGMAAAEETPGNPWKQFPRDQPADLLSVHWEDPGTSLLQPLHEEM